MAKEMSNYKEQLATEIKTIPIEYLPNLIKIFGSVVKRRPEKRPSISNFSAGFDMPPNVVSREVFRSTPRGRKNRIPISIRMPERHSKRAERSAVGEGLSLHPSHPLFRSLQALSYASNPL